MSVMSSIVSKASSRNRLGAILFATGTVLGVGYPFAVYFLRGSISAANFVLLALCLLMLRLVTLRPATARLWTPPLLVAAAALGGTLLLDAEIAEKAYPALMSLTAAFAFAWSLRHPPSLIERFARLRRPDLPLEAIAYCRKVTLIWVVWLLINAAVASILALRGDLGFWTLWTGLISYFVTGLLVVSEIAVRHLLPAYRSGR